MSKEEVIELLESLKGDTSGYMQSISETHRKEISQGLDDKIEEAIKKLNQMKDE